MPVRADVRRHCAVNLALALGWLLLGGRVHAHGNPPELAFWGNFGSSTALCQRVIGTATAQCTETAVAARTACLSARQAGESCDEGAVGEAIAAGRERARALIQHYCTNQQASLLQFGTLGDVLIDVSAACGEIETAATSAVFGPIMSIGSGAAESPTACMQAAASHAPRVLRYALRARQRALDRIARGMLTLDQKRAALGRSDAYIARALESFTRRIRQTCTDDAFAALYHRDIGSFLANLAARADCFAGASYVQGAVVCPPAECGNGIQERGEECDDANVAAGDGCEECLRSECESFSSTFELIQRAIFENRGCTADACHGSARSGGMDLRAGRSYASLVDVRARSSALNRIEPGDQERSDLWLRLAKLTLDRSDVPRAGMPLGGPPVSEAELEALRLWIHSGAPESGVVAGTAELLDACLPAPEPLPIKALDPPPAGEGVQLRMARWTLTSSESEVCFATYYDVSEQVPPERVTPDGRSFIYDRIAIRQSPNSHHLIVNLYDGEKPPTDPVWGAYTCKGGSRNGQSCNPLDLGFCGAEAECATSVVPGAACIGFGPADSGVGVSSNGVTGTQETAFEARYPEGVYATMPLRGVILWNSHAFNISDHPVEMEAWVNFYFSPTPATPCTASSTSRTSSTPACQRSTRRRSASPTPCRAGPVSSS